MHIDKTDKTPLYIQIKNSITNAVRDGQYPPGSILPTEEALCEIFNVSLYPVRQAMRELAEEGVVVRTRRKGTVINQDINISKFGRSDKKPIGLILPALSQGFCGHILEGFEKEVRSMSRGLMVMCSEHMPEEEEKCIGIARESGIGALAVFPCDTDGFDKRIAHISGEAPVVLIDRNAGCMSFDYVGSDNEGGTYAAVRHLSECGFKNLVFISTDRMTSSVEERMKGYFTAAAELGLCTLENICVGSTQFRYSNVNNIYCISGLKDKLLELTGHLPLGIIAANDMVALQCAEIFEKAGLQAGKDIGIIGFDNSIFSGLYRIPLTTVAQNGFLIGKTAARICLEKSKTGSGLIQRYIVPTQLIIRKSCGETDKIFSV